MTVPACSAGRIDVCPSCAAYVDVPEPTYRPSVTPAIAATHSNAALHFDLIDGLPRPDWKRFAAGLAETLSDGELDAAYHSAVKLWIDALRSHLSSNYTVAETENFVVLCPRDKEGSNRTAEFCERCRAELMQLLADYASDAGYGPHVVLAFATQDAYYDYVSYYYADGEHAGSSGGCLREHYVHIALPFSGDWRRTVAHELTHVLLGDRGLPLWVEEGLTQLMEDRIAEGSTFQPDHALRRKHVGHWADCGLQTFWDGTAFSAAVEDRQMLAYSLARTMLHLILRDYRGGASGFLGEADWRDGGESAAQEHLRCSLSILVSGFLGEGAWNPPPRVAEVEEESGRAT